jgi:hypothetical protein
MDLIAALARMRAQTRVVKKWWLREHGSLWQEWAVVLPGGDVVVYDESGRSVRRSSYGTRRKARSALQLKGFRRLKRKELEVLRPPEIH